MALLSSLVSGLAHVDVGLGGGLGPSRKWPLLDASGEGVLGLFGLDPRSGVSRHWSLLRHIECIFFIQISSTAYILFERKKSGQNNLNKMRSKSILVYFLEGDGSLWLYQTSINFRNQSKDQERTLTYSNSKVSNVTNGDNSKTIQKTKGLSLYWIYIGLLS